MFVADQKYSRTGHNAGKEVVAFRKFTTELPGAIHRRIHFPPKLTLRAAQSSDDIVQGNVLSNNHDVNIAVRPLASRRNRTVYEGELNPVAQWRETVAKNAGYAKSLADKTA